MSEVGLHDVCSQHLRALRTIGCDPSGPFVTLLIKMKLNQSTMFEWQKHTQENSDVPHYAEILEFINLRARASETVGHHAPEDWHFPCGGAFQQWCTLGSRHDSHGD